LIANVVFEHAFAPFPLAVSVDVATRWYQVSTVNAGAWYVEFVAPEISA
jgi:hypothetical protein